MSRDALARTLFAGAATLVAAAYALPSRAETVIVRGPGGVIMQQLKQVGTSVSNHVAITAERKGNIASLRRQLEECGSCAERAEIAAKLNYWTGIDSQVEYITQSVMESMGYGRHSDLRVLTDPHARA